MHVWVNEQSSSDRHSGCCGVDGCLVSSKQLRNGSPIRPGGQLQDARWFCVVHTAVTAHGFASTQGLIFGGVGADER